MNQFQLEYRSGVFACQWCEKATMQRKARKGDGRSHGSAGRRQPVTAWGCTRQDAAHRSRAANAAQIARRGGGRIWRARLSRGIDQRHHPPRRDCAWQFLHLFRSERGNLPGARPLYERAACDHVTPLAQAAPDEISAERIGLESFLGFVREHKEIYRIIDEAEFVDYASYRRHYETTVARVRQRLEDARRGRDPHRCRGNSRLGDRRDERLLGHALRPVGRRRRYFRDRGDCEMILSRTGRRNAIDQGRSPRARNGWSGVDPDRLLFFRS